MASRWAVLAGHVRLTHPFPSVLDGLVAGGAAMLAGAGLEVGLRLGASMILLQASVGALNDFVDAPRDAGLKPGKPIPARLVEPAAARIIAVVAGVSGIALAVPSGPAVVALAGFLLGLGYAYDLRLKGTPWSWVAFALAIPLFPTYGWLGATGALPAIWIVVLPTAMLAGAALAISNAGVDVERDRAAAIASVATHLGRVRAWAIHVVLLATVVTIAVLSLMAGGRGGWHGVGVLAAGGAVAVGAAWARDVDPARRERGWELEAIGMGLLAAAWLAGAVAAGLTGGG